MGYRCCVPYCNGNYTKETKATLFSFPKNVELSNKWLKAIDRANFKAGRSAKVCIHHFAEEFIQRDSRAIRDDGSLLIVPRDVPTLKADAYPTLFLNEPRCPLLKVKALHNKHIKRSNKDKDIDLNVDDGKKPSAKIKISNKKKIPLEKNELKKPKTNREAKKRSLSPRKTTITKHLKTNDEQAIHIKHETEEIDIKFEPEDEILFDIDDYSENNLRVHEIICRVCLKENSSEMFPLTSSVDIDGKSIVIFDCLKRLYRKEISTDDQFPVSICEDCIQRAVISYLLLQQLEESEEKLKQIYKENMVENILKQSFHPEINEENIMRNNLNKSNDRQIIEENVNDILKKSRDHQHIEETMNDILKNLNTVEEENINATNDQIDEEMDDIPDTDCYDIIDITINNVQEENINPVKPISQQNRTDLSIKENVKISSSTKSLKEKVTRKTKIIHCKKCEVSINIPDLTKHLLVCKLKKENTRKSGKTYELLICRICHTLMDSKENITHSKICRTPENMINNKENNLTEQNNMSHDISSLDSNVKKRNAILKI